jgi:hypothetical protein
MGVVVDAGNVGMGEVWAFLARRDIAFCVVWVLSGRLVYILGLIITFFEGL